MFFFIYHILLCIPYFGPSLSRDDQTVTMLNINIYRLSFVTCSRLINRVNGLLIVRSCVEPEMQRAREQYRPEIYAGTCKQKCNEDDKKGCNFCCKVLLQSVITEKQQLRKILQPFGCDWVCYRFVTVKGAAYGEGHRLRFCRAKCSVASDQTKLIASAILSIKYYINYKLYISYIKCLNIC